MEVDPSKLEVAPEPSLVGTPRYPLLTHERVDTRPCRNINMKQYLCVKHAMPRTRLTNTILYENVSHERHLEMKVSSIKHRRGRTMSTMDINKRAFVAQQERKKRKWKREDEVRLASMNLPSLSPVERRPSVDVVYHSSNNEPRASSGERKPILPMMKVRRERTEIVFHEDKTFITKMPAFVEVNEAVQTVFDAYRGKSYLARDLCSRDERFRRLETTLQTPGHATPGVTPTTSWENFTCKSRAANKRLQGLLGGDMTAFDAHPAQQFAEARVLIASRGKSRENNMAAGASGLDFVTDCRRPSMRRADILHSFKTQDLQELSKSLTRESHIDVRDIRPPKTAGAMLTSTPIIGQRAGGSNAPSASGARRPQHHVPSLGMSLDNREDLS